MDDRLLRCVAGLSTMCFACGPAPPSSYLATASGEGTSLPSDGVSDASYDGIVRPDGLDRQDTVETVIWPGGDRRIGVMVGPWHYVAVIVSVTGPGQWVFTARTDFAGASACYREMPTLIVGTYWRDRGTEGDPWHSWPGGGVVCWPFPLFGTEVVAGSADIEFAFVFGNWNGYPVKVFVGLDASGP